MNANAQPLAAAEPLNSTDPAIIIPRETALSVLTNQDEFDAFYARVKATVDAHVPDVSTAKGRAAITALAFKVVKSKTAIDAAGKQLTEEWRTQTAKVDAARKALEWASAWCAAVGVDPEFPDAAVVADYGLGPVEA